MTTGRLSISLRNFSFWATVLLLSLGALHPIFKAHAEQIAATYRHGNLAVTIPYDSPQ